MQSHTATCHPVRFVFGGPVGVFRPFFEFDNIVLTGPSACFTPARPEKCFLQLDIVALGAPLRVTIMEFQFPSKMSSAQK